MRNNELYNRMKSIVEKVSQKYLGGESYFTELDEMIRNDEELIIKVINHISNSYGYNIVSTGNFGMKIAELLEKQ